MKKQVLTLMKSNSSLISYYKSGNNVSKGNFSVIMIIFCFLTFIAISIVALEIKRKTIKNSTEIERCMDYILLDENYSKKKELNLRDIYY